MKPKYKVNKIWCSYCQSFHNETELDTQLLLDGELRTWCNISGYELWLSKEDKDYIKKNLKLDDILGKRVY